MPNSLRVLVEGKHHQRTYLLLGFDGTREHAKSICLARFRAELGSKYDVTAIRVAADQIDEVVSFQPQLALTTSEVA